MTFHLGDEPSPRPCRPRPPPPRRALAADLVRADAPELRLIHRWLDSWSGIGLIVTGMSYQGFTVSLGEHGVGRWIAAFLHGRGGHEPIAAAGTAQEATPWRAVQRAAWGALTNTPENTGGIG